MVTRRPTPLIRSALYRKAAAEPTPASVDQPARRYASGYLRRHYSGIRTLCLFRIWHAGRAARHPMVGRPGGPPGTTSGEEHFFWNAL